MEEKERRAGTARTGEERNRQPRADDIPCGCTQWRDIDPEQEDLARLMRRCGHFLYHRNGERRSQSRILYILSDRGEMTQKELMEIMHVQPGSMSEILNKLEGRGCLVRGRDEEDRRRVILRITEEGRRTAREWRDDSEAELFADLTQEEKATLRVLLIKIIHSWEHTTPPQE